MLDGDLLGVDRGEHVLEGLADELQWLVVVREVVENDNGRVVVGRLHGKGEGIERSCRHPWRKSSGGRESVCIPPPGRHQEKKAIRGSVASVPAGNSRCACVEACASL